MQRCVHRISALQRTVELLGDRHGVVLCTPCSLTTLTVSWTGGQVVTVPQNPKQFRSPLLFLLLLAEDGQCKAVSVPLGRGRQPPGGSFPWEEDFLLSTPDTGADGKENLPHPAHLRGL